MKRFTCIEMRSECGRKVYIPEKATMRDLVEMGITGFNLRPKLSSKKIKELLGNRTTHDLIRQRLLMRAGIGGLS